MKEWHNYYWMKFSGRLYWQQWEVCWYRLSLPWSSG